MLGGDVCVGWSARTGLTQVTPMHGDHMMSTRLAEKPLTRLSYVVLLPVFRWRSDWHNLSRS